MSNDTKNHRKADIVFQNGFVYTVDQKRSTAEAVAVNGKNIVYAGSNSGAADFIGPKTEVIDLDGKMVLPGFIDAHTHAFAGGLIMKGVDLQSDDADEVMARIRDYVAETDDEVVHGYGVRFTPWTDGDPTAAMLDEIESDRPIYFWTIDGHGAWVNSKTLEIAGIDKDTPDTAPGF